MLSIRSFILVCIVVLFTASAFALECGTRTCSDDNSCCNDVLMGPTCFIEGNAKCSPTGSMAADGTMTSRLCGANDAACGPVCYNPESYFCCAGQLMQNGQPCASAPTSAPTSAPMTSAPTEAPTDAPTSAPTEAPTSAPTEAPTSAPTEAPTSAPTEAPTSSPTSPANNCFGYRNTFGIFCAADEVCCGAGTISPSCISNDGSQKCCVWFLSATQCEADEVCGGSGGPGASSYATCGAPETQFCNFGTNTNIYCLKNQTCCNSQGYPDCCEDEDSTSSSSSSSSSSSPSSTDSSSSSPSTDSSSSSSSTDSSSSSSSTDSSSSSSSTDSSSPSSSTDSSSSSPSSSEDVVLNNCPGAASTAGVNCSESETCCGANTMTPSCLPADGSKKCCVWYLSSTQCDLDAVCGGDLGYGASSYARCGPAGTTFCNKGDAQNAFCAEDTPTCCGNYGQLAFCCASNCTCPSNGGFECVC